jgi:hypothetical protein
MAGDRRRRSSSSPLDQRIDPRVSLIGGRAGSRLSVHGIAREERVTTAYVYTLLRSLGSRLTSREWLNPDAPLSFSFTRAGRLPTANSQCPDPSYKNIEHRGKQQAEQRHAEHPEEYCGAERLTQFGPGSCR